LGEKGIQELVALQKEALGELAHTILENAKAN